MEFPYNQPDRNTFGLVIQCDENVHEAWKALINKYEVSNENQ